MARFSNPERIERYHEERFDARRINRNYESGVSKQFMVTPSSGAVKTVYAMKIAEFTGEASELKVDIGTTRDDPDEFIDNWNITAEGLYTPVTATGDLYGTYTAQSPFGIYRCTETTPIYIRFTDANIGSLTAGEIVVIIHTVDLSSFRR